MLKFLVDSIYIGGLVFKNKKRRRIALGISAGIGILMAANSNYSGIAGFIFTGGLSYLGLLFIMGVYVMIKDAPNKRERQRYADMFQQANFSAFNGSYPQFLTAEETEYLRVLSFKSMIPLKEWQNKHSLFEAYFNAQIIKIINKPDDNNIVKLHIVKKALSDNLPWDDKHIPQNKDVISLGVDYVNYILLDLNKNAHAFIAGETGSGKSNILKCLIYQCALKGHEIKLIDFKRGVSFADFDRVVEIYSDYDKIQAVLETLVNETKRRPDLFREKRVESMEQYNRLAPYNQMKRIVLFIDELAELIRAGDRETSKAITDSLESLTRLSRAVGINVIMGIQMSSAEIIARGFPF